MDIQTTAKRLDAAISFLKNSTHELKEGRLVSLDAFQEQVRQICDEMVVVTGTEKELYAEKLEALAAILRDFELDLRARQVEVNYELMNLNAKQKALKSYESASHSTNPKKEDGNK